MTLRERYHVVLGEACGKLAGWLLLRLAKHAIAIDDWVTYERVKAVIAEGVNQGWDESNPTRHIRPKRGKP